MSWFLHNCVDNGCSLISELLDFSLQAMTVSLMACCYSVPKEHPGLRHPDEKETIR